MYKFIVLVVFLIGTATSAPECGAKIFVDDSEIIDSDDYSISEAADCWWTVETDLDRILYISSDSVDIRKNSDVIEVYSGPSRTSQIMLTQSDNSAVAIYSADNTILVHFSSKSISSTAKFQLKLEKAVNCSEDMGQDAGNTACTRLHTNVSCYCASYDGRSWDNAMVFCQNNSMSLVSIESVEEDDAINDAWGYDTYFWTSGNDRATEGVWLWESTGQLINYTNWYPGQPDNQLNEHCLSKNFYANGTWADQWGFLAHGAICELHP